MTCDPFTEFGVTAHAEIDFDLDNASPAPGIIVARWVMLHVQSNPLPICTRPRVLIKGKRT